jgi:hypothetical protein
VGVLTLANERAEMARAGDRESALRVASLDQTSDALGRVIDDLQANVAGSIGSARSWVRWWNNLPVWERRVF